MKVLGIDEAGRGCVLGALVVAGFVSEREPHELTEAGANDSKKLSAKRRQAARASLASLGTPDVREIPATAIDAGNLNTLEEAVIIDLIRTHQPDRVLIDALGHPSALPATRARLIAGVGGDHPFELVIEPKADGRYPEVGAASIFAKTHRDDALDALRSEWGELGSGYPSDPATRAWLLAIAKRRDPWPAFVRTRWGTVRDLAQQALFDEATP